MRKPRNQTVRRALLALGFIWTLTGELGSPDIQITSDAKAASQMKPAKLMAFFS